MFSIFGRLKLKTQLHVENESPSSEMARARVIGALAGPVTFRAFAVDP